MIGFRMFCCSLSSALNLSARSLPVLCMMSCGALRAAPRVQPVPVPEEIRSAAFVVRVNGVAVDVAHAAASLEYASFDMTGPVTVEVTATEPEFWNRGVDVEPWRLGIRPERKGNTIRFKLNAPAKLSISRPRDFLNHAKMLYLFAGLPSAPPPSGPTVQVYKPGIYHTSLNPRSGDTIYLAPGAVIFGSLNLWQVRDVKILGRGTIIYSGPQNPDNDEGWMQKPDWHCIGAYEAQNVQVSGLTCVVRSRTWSIQMKDSTHFVFDDIRVIGGNPGNSNQDGMDWLGGGDAVVRNSFLRASDDVFAMQGNWDGYEQADIQRPGHDVQNILIEDSQLSTSISNIVRAGWPQKSFNTRNFTLRDSDVLHAGIGACGQRYALLGFWGADGARGSHTNYTFQNIFLDNWYSLVQMEQEEPGVKDFVFRNIWALEQPPLTDSTIAGGIGGVTFDNVKVGQRRLETAKDLPLTVSGNARPPVFAPVRETAASFTVKPATAMPGQKVTLMANYIRDAYYTWLFGDGTQAHGRKVKHRFPDALGTGYDGRAGAGNFRVLLHAETKKGEDWAAQGVVIVDRWKPAQIAPPALVPGLAWKFYTGAWTQLPDLLRETAAAQGESDGLSATPEDVPDYVVAWDGFLEIPADGGYTFHLIARDGARLAIDGEEVARTGKDFAQVCGSPGNALRYERGSLGLRAGKHAIHVEGLHSRSEGYPRLLWEGPGVTLADIPSAAYSRPRVEMKSQWTSLQGRKKHLLE